MDSSLVLSPKLNPCVNPLSPLYPFTPCSYSPPLRLSSCYSSRFYSMVTVKAAKKNSQSVRSEFDDRINGDFSPDSNSRFLDRVNFLFIPLLIHCELVFSIKTIRFGFMDWLVPQWINFELEFFSFSGLFTFLLQRLEILSEIADLQLLVSHRLLSSSLSVCTQCLHFQNGFSCLISIIWRTILVYGSKK